MEPLLLIVPIALFALAAPFAGSVLGGWIDRRLRPGAYRSKPQDL